MSEERRFAFQTRAARVVFGAGALGSLSDEIGRLEKSRAFLVGTPGRGSMIEDLRKRLGSRAVGSYSAAVVHVPAANVTESLELLRQARADCIIALGGGSAIGLAKALARETALPIIAIPTTYSGSEMTAVYGITAGEKKVTGRDQRVAPSVVLYDPGLTLDLPPLTSAASGMNAVAHCVEALYAPDANPVASLLAGEGLRLLAKALPRIVHRTGDLDARGDALLGAHFAGSALDATTMGLHHRLCHVLGGMFGLPHAMTHAVLLPHVVGFVAPAAGQPMKVIASILGGGDAASGLARLNHTLDIKVTLGALGLAERDLDRAADEVARSKPASPRPATAADVRRILHEAL